MEGKTARLFTERLIHAISKATVINRKLTYDLLGQGADEFVSLTNSIKESQTVTTVASQASYDLNADYMQLYLKTGDKKGGDYFIQYSDGTNTHITLFKPYQNVIYDNQTTAVLIPSNFTIYEKTSLETQISSTTTSAGTQSGGSSTLTDTATTFTDEAVSARDIVHNSTKDATGVVIAVDTNALTTAMFNHKGDPVGWASGDAYIIQPVQRMQLQFDPPPSTASHTATVYYAAKANPVYTDFATWQIQDQWHKAFCYWAADAYLAQYEIETPEQGAKLVSGEKYNKKFEDIVRRAKYEIDKGLGKKGYSMRGEA